MQQQLSKGKLLNEKGDLLEKGYAFSLVKDYSRDQIKAPKFRIKEWDYYYFGNFEYGVALTIDDNGYMSLASITFLDFKSKKQITKSLMGFMPLGKLKMPVSSAIGDSRIDLKNCSLLFSNDGKNRRLSAKMNSFDNDNPFSCNLEVKEHNQDSLVIATPFDKKRHFYYNQKINNLEANGTITIGKKKINVSSWFGVLDWGRGVWTYTNTWYWSSLSGISNGHLVGFNLGYGFGNTKAASENVVFFDGKGYKLEDVEFQIPNKDGKDDFLSPWKLVSKDGNIDLTFTPILNRKAYTSVLIIASDQNQVFGVFKGTIKVDGQPIEINNVMGFAEKVKNRW